MKIGSEYYELTGKALRQIGDELLKERNKVFDAFRKFAVKHGAKPRVYHCHSANDSMRILGFYFDKPPSDKLWRRKEAESGIAYIPRRDTKEGRALHAEFKKLPEWKCTKLQEAVKFDMVFHQNYVYYFSWFSYENGFMGVKVPVFDNESNKQDPRLVYKPVKGMKAISLKLHNKKVAMTKKSYQATLR